MRKVLRNLEIIDKTDFFLIIQFCFIFLLCLILPQKNKSKTTNRFFRQNDLFEFSAALRGLLFFDKNLTKTIINPFFRGLRAWEYGLFLSQLKLKKGWKILDVGSGDSSFPYYLANLGLNVETIDLAVPEEQTNLLTKKNRNAVTHTVGSMLDLPFKKNTFDLVYCISSIEHLDFLPDKKKLLSYVQMKNNVMLALKEMVRVLKPGGYFYLTTDLYFPNKQHKDNYSSYHRYKKIRAVFDVNDFDKLFIQTLKKSGCELVGETKFDFQNLLTDISRSNYRGQFITTFALLGRKKSNLLIISC